MINFIEVYKEHEDKFNNNYKELHEFYSFNNLSRERQKSTRKDLCAFLILDDLLNKSKQFGWDVVGAAEHDRIFLTGDLEKFNEIVTQEDVIDLIRCGVWYDEELDSLYINT